MKLLQLGGGNQSLPILLARCGDSFVGITTSMRVSDLSKHPMSGDCSQVFV